MATEFVVPPPEFKIDRKVVEAEHPDYQRQFRELRLGREAYEGSGGFAPWLGDVTIGDTWPDDEQAGTLLIDESRRTYLFRHPREKAKFTRRAMMAYYVNVIKKAVNMIAGFLTKKQPDYAEYPDGVSEWMSEVNAAGDTWEQFKSHDVVLPVLYYGWLPLLFRRDATPGATTAAQQEEMGGGLQVETINPETVIHWVANAAGFEWFKVKAKIDITTPMDEQPVTVDRYTWYTQEGWWYVDDPDGKASELQVVESGTWANGMPIVVWAIKGGALTGDANTIAREMYNVASLVQEEERSTTFSMLSAPEAGAVADNRVQTVGGDNIFYFPHDARHRPDWMAPPPQVLAHLMGKLVHLTAEILSTMGLDFDQGGGQTGMAFQFKMSKIVRLLQVLADSFSRAESRSLVRVGIEERDPVDPESRCVWPSEFDAKDIEKEMEALQVVLDRVKSAAAQVEAQVKIAKAGLGDMDEELAETIRDEVEESVEEQGLDEMNNPDDLRARAEAARLEAEGGPEDAGDLQPDGGAR
jgi:hypothetical protein